MSHVKKPVLIRAGSAPPIRRRDQPYVSTGLNALPQPMSRTPKGTSTAGYSNLLGVGSGHSSAHSGIPPNGSVKSPRTSSSKRKQKRHTRICQHHPLYDTCSVALSRTESVLVSSSGDVLVCRCRRSSTPYSHSSRSTTNIDEWATNLMPMPCCDTSEVCGVGVGEGAWSPVFGTPVSSRHRGGSQHHQHTKLTESEGHSTYEWEKPQLQPGLLGGAMPTPVDQNNITKKRVDQPRRSSTGNSSRSPSMNGGSSRSGRNTHLQTHSAPSKRDNVDSNTHVSYAPKEDLHDQYSDFVDGGIMPPPSFDYNGFENDMVDMNLDDTTSAASIQHTPSGRQQQHSPTQAMDTIQENYEDEKKDESSPSQQLLNIQPPAFLHGIPTFLSSLSQIRITKVSAHPMGAHVLLISQEALLFTYGLNHHGQLGIGVKSSLNDSKRGFMTEPTIVTPLLENGGKAVQCAAGVDHSLVVVQTEGRRLQKLQYRMHAAQSEMALNFQRVTSSPSRLSMDEEGYYDDAHINHDEDASANLDQHSGDSNEELVLHHQVYGFGSNSFMKLGLVSASIEETDESGTDGAEELNDVLLPRRVALHCTVWPETASAQYDSATTGSSSSASTHDLPPPGIFELSASTEHSAALVRRATGDVEVHVWGNATLGALGISVGDSDSSIPFDNRLGQRRPAPKANNIFPIPTVLEPLSYRPTRDPKVEYPTGLALGQHCSFVVLSSGRCKAFGFSAEGMLGHAYGFTHSMQPKEVFLPPAAGQPKRPCIVSVSAGAHHAIALTEEGKAYSWGIDSNNRLGLGAHPDDSMNVMDDEDVATVEWVPQEIVLEHPSLRKQKDGSPPPRIVRVCAGYDNSVLVLENGQVLSFGKGSGRAGLGEIGEDVNTPCPMYGGLKLFAAPKRKPQTTTKTVHQLTRRSSAPLFKGMVQSAVI